MIDLNQEPQNEIINDEYSYIKPDVIRLFALTYSKGLDISDLLKKYNTTEENVFKSRRFKTFCTEFETNNTQLEYNDVYFDKKQLKTELIHLYKASEGNITKQIEVMKMLIKTLDDANDIDKLKDIFIDFQS